LDDDVDSSLEGRRDTTTFGSIQPPHLPLCDVDGTDWGFCA
jgi:hypothetical protein